MRATIAQWSLTRPTPKVERFLARPAFSPEAETAAAAVLAEVRAYGNRAVLAAARRFDGAALRVSEMRVTDAELKAATREVPARVRRAVNDAHTRVRRYAEASLREAWHMPLPRGGFTGEFFSPMGRVGVYVPGGTAPLASTAVMTVTLARTAGVREIVAATPCGPDGRVNPAPLRARRGAGRHPPDARHPGRDRRHEGRRGKRIPAGGHVAAARVHRDEPVSKDYSRGLLPAQLSYALPLPDREAANPVRGVLQSLHGTPRDPVVGLLHGGPPHPWRIRAEAVKPLGAVLYRVVPSRPYGLEDLPHGPLHRGRLRGDVPLSLLDDDHPYLSLLLMSRASEGMNDLPPPAQKLFSMIARSLDNAISY